MCVVEQQGEGRGERDPSFIYISSTVTHVLGVGGGGVSLSC